MKLFDWLPFGRVPEISPEALNEQIEKFQIVLLRFVLPGGAQIRRIATDIGLAPLILALCRFQWKLTLQQT